MPDNLLKSKAFKLKGRLYTLTVLQLLSVDQILFEQQLEQIIAKAPRMFEGTPIVLDCSLIQDSEIDLQLFHTMLRRRNLLVVAIQGGSPLLSSIAQCMGLAVLHGSSSQDKVFSTDIHEEISEPPPEKPVAKPNALKSKLQTTPVRSGQQVVCKGGDLVITSSVSHGAELLADGNIHVYGVLRGRALAGISGNRAARIFCLSLDAELVSIAGYYRLSDVIEPNQGPCQIYLRDEHIIIEPLC